MSKKIDEKTNVRVDRMTEIITGKTPNHVSTNCGQTLQNGNLSHVENLKISSGKCRNDGSYVIKNGNGVQIYTCGVHVDQAKNSLRKIEEYNRLNDLMSLWSW